MDRSPIHCGQINHQRSRMATSEFPALVRQLSLDVVLVHEPYDDQMIIKSAPGADAGVYIARGDWSFSILGHLCNRCCLVVHLDTGVFEGYLVSAYFKYSDDIDIHILHLERVLEHLRGNKVVIGADCNVHSPLWFSDHRQYTGRSTLVEHRRSAMEGFVLGRVLILLNKEGQPSTFSTVNVESNIDVTLVTRIVMGCDWTVHETASSSDH